MSPDLFPEHVGQTKGGTTATAQTNQTNQHYEKQDNVGSGQRIKGGCVIHRVGNRTSEAFRHPRGAQLRVREDESIQIEGNISLTRATPVSRRALYDSMPHIVEEREGTCLG